MSILLDTDPARIRTEYMIEDVGDNISRCAKGNRL